MQLAADWFEWDLSTHTLTVKGQIPNTGFLNLSSLAFNTGDHTIDNVEKVVFTDGAKTGSDADRLFYAMKELTSIEGLEYLDTSSATNMEKMFMDRTRFTSLDLSHFDTSRVTDMSQMFQGCTSLKILNLGSFDTSKVTDMEAMFASCTSLKTICIR
ncbi:MAG: BspA family leucine-rich repeat surface protein [Oscillospiraceae bacterium]|nr:BspA family leucine-rich repeat surface protein [Oscillospiraceae bacterium]